MGKARKFPSVLLQIILLLSLAEGLKEVPQAASESVEQILLRCISIARKMGGNGVMNLRGGRKVPRRNETVSSSLDFIPSSTFTGRQLAVFHLD
eukprot:767305-Hanusia_phi.AAC.3